MPFISSDNGFDQHLRYTCPNLLHITFAQICAFGQNYNKPTVNDITISSARLLSDRLPILFCALTLI